MSPGRYREAIRGEGEGPATKSRSSAAEREWVDSRGYTYTLLIMSLTSEHGDRNDDTYSCLVYQ